MKDIRAQRAEIEARAMAWREKNQIDWERVGPEIMGAGWVFIDEINASGEPDDISE